MEQTKALNALEPFLALSKSATSPSAACDLITRATSHPSTFIFTELLNTPSLSSLLAAPAPDPSYIAHYALLNIFSYGTYSDYTRRDHPHPLPVLNDAQLLKLRQLTLLTLARTPALLTYTHLQHALGLATSPRELEEIVISAIYAGLVQGALDPHAQVVRIASVAPLRDVQPGAVAGMIGTLEEWSRRCADTLAELERRIEEVRAVAVTREREEEEWRVEVERLVDGKEPSGDGENASAGGKGRGLSAGGSGGAGKRGLVGGSGEDEDDMDLDEEEDEGVATGERRPSKPAKKRGFMGTSFGRTK